MSAIAIDIQRLTISLHGISAEVVEQAVSGLEQELQRRLGVWPCGELTALDMVELSLPRIESEQILDSSALRGLIAERLATALLSAMPNFTESA